MTTPSLELADVTKRFGSITAVRGVNVTAAPGEFVVLVGPSGCGKSTLLRLIAGFERATRGSIRIEGREVNDIDPRHRDIAMVFQSYALYPHMTVAENLAFPLKMRGTKKGAAAKAVKRVSDTIGLDGLLERYPRQLSGGQRQRVAMGRAIVREPSLFLFDEPLSNLDAALRVRMRIEIKQLHRRVGNTAVYVTHDQVEAMTMADKIVVMKSGEIMQIGTPEEVYDTPQTTFVAQFIGSPSMNLIPGRIEAREGKPHVVAQNGEGLPIGIDPSVQDGRRVIFGVRPDHARIAESGAPGLHMDVEVSEMLGRENLLYGKLAGEEVCVATGERRAVAPGDRITLAPSPEALHLFDAESGMRI